MGKIVIGDFSEEFRSPIGFWSQAEYRAHWEDAIRRLISGQDRSCLITTMLDPQNANFIVWWPLWRSKGDTVLCRNQVLFLKNLPGRFDPANPYASVSEYSPRKGKDKPSEWQIPISDLAAHLNTRA